MLQMRFGPEVTVCGRQDAKIQEPADGIFAE